MELCSVASPMKGPLLRRRGPAVRSSAIRPRTQLPKSEAHGGPPSLPLPKMNLLHRGLMSALALFVVACMLRVLPKVKNGLLPGVQKFLGLSPTHRRNLKAEVEAAFPHMLIPEKYVQYPRPRLASMLKTKLKDPFQKGPRNLGEGRGKVFVAPSMVPDPAKTQVNHAKGIYLDWGTGKKKFMIPRPRRGIGIEKINPLPPDIRPVVALVNSKSGGKQGKNVLKTLRGALNKAQVFDIRKADIKEALSLFTNLTTPITLLICGGDGTASRVFEIVEEMEWRVPPRLTILPLGTGNDIARVLDWGDHVIDWSGGYFSCDPEEALMSVFADIDRALERRIDRWELAITPGTAVPSLDRHKQPVKYMLAYLGVGVDGKVALDFHRLRERFPRLFVSRFINKFFYGLMGFRDLIVRSCKNLPDKVELWVDGKQLKLPPLTESFIILNINSHAGGVMLWPDEAGDAFEAEGPIVPMGANGPDGAPIVSLKREPVDAAGVIAQEGDPKVDFGPSRYDDGLLEIVATTGVLHLGKIRVGLDRPVRLAQAREIRIRTKTFLPGQVDGEPWKVPRCELTIRHKGTARTLQHLSKELVSYSKWLEQRGHLKDKYSTTLLEKYKTQT